MVGGGEIEDVRGMIRGRVCGRYGNLEGFYKGHRGCFILGFLHRNAKLHIQKYIMQST